MALIMMALLEERALNSEKLKLREEKRQFRCILMRNLVFNFQALAI